MEGENKKASKYLADQPASVHNYGKLSQSESRRTHSSPTSTLRTFPHSLRHDQKHQTKLKPGGPRAKGKAADEEEEEEEEESSAEGWCLGDEEPEEKDRDEDFRRKRKLSAGSATSECSSDGDVWKLRSEVQGKSVQSERLSGKTIKKLSVINNNSYEDSGLKFAVHKSTPNLLRCESSASGSVSDSLLHLDQRYKIIHFILPKINRAISESHESLKKRSPDHFYGSGRMIDVGGKSDGSQSEDDENEGLIDGHRHAVVQSGKERKESKSRWPHKKTADIMPGLRSLMGRRARGGGGEGEEALPPGAAAPLAPFKSESSSSVDIPEIRYSAEGDDEEASVKKCDTVYALTNLIRADSSLQVEPIKPINRLRVPPNGAFGSTSRMCSRCSSLLSMASSSRYSINTTGSGFVNCSSAAEKPPEPLILCKLCLTEVPDSMSMEINNCGCIFCKDCMRLYVEFEIQEGAYDISCPDAQCVRQGVVSLEEAEALVAARMMERYLRFRLNREVDMDRNRTWCPRAGCETVCDVCPREKCSPTSVHCPTCNSDFCSNCKNAWHKGLTCEENSKKLAKEGRSDFAEPGIPFDSDSIKCCPMCNVPIEKDEGCAQMMCKRCKHVFCWYCLASLDDDFLLRHYDKGPCKNKLGHSRASVIWHRTQVIGIFAGLGLLLLVASPLLLLAAPCIVCCKCRVCSGTKLDAEDDLPEDSGT